MTTTSYPTHALKSGDKIKIAGRTATVFDTVRINRGWLLIIGHDSKGGRLERMATNDEQIKIAR
jgi:hypothetical protein